MEEFRIIAQSSQPDYSKDYLAKAHLFVPACGITKTTQRSVLVLPHHEGIRELVRFYEIFLLDYKVDCLWTGRGEQFLDNDILEDEGVIEELIRKAGGAIRSGEIISVCPYSLNTLSAQWIARLPNPKIVHGETASFARRFRHKHALHRDIASFEQPCELEKVKGVNLARGYVCHNSRLLLVAFDLLTRAKVVDFVLKPADGMGGYGIKFVRTVEELIAFEYPIGEDIILAEKLPIDRRMLPSSELNCSIEFSNGRILEYPTAQIISQQNEWIGGISPLHDNEVFQRDAMDQASRVLDFLKANDMAGPGGLDFVSVNSKAYVIDNNLARETDCHYPKYFQQRYTPSMPFAAMYFEESDMSIFDLWDSLSRSGLAFKKRNGTGVFPMVYVPGLYSMMISFAVDPLEAFDNLKRVEDLILSDS